MDCFTVYRDVFAPRCRGFAANYQWLFKKKASGTQGISNTDKLVMFASDVSETSYVIALQIKSIRDHVAIILKKNTDVSVSAIIAAMIAATCSSVVPVLIVMQTNQNQWFPLVIISGNLTAHLSSLVHPDRKVFAFGVTQDSHEMIEDKLEGMAARSILFIRHVLKLYS